MRATQFRVLTHKGDRDLNCSRSRALSRMQPHAIYIAIIRGTSFPRRSAPAENITLKIVHWKEQNSSTVVRWRHASPSRRYFARANNRAIKKKNSHQLISLSREIYIDISYIKKKYSIENNCVYRTDQNIKTTICRNKKYSKYGSNMQAKPSPW